MESKLTAMSATFDDRVAKIENAVSDQDVRIARLKKFNGERSPRDYSPVGLWW